MSNLNNVYGQVNGCPPIMNDGRGVKTNYLNNQQLNDNLRQKVNASSSLEYKLALQQQGIDLVNGQTLLDINEFNCITVPDGNIQLNKNINLTTSGGDFRSQFKN
jgi:hypothetical protein